MQQKINAIRKQINKLKQKESKLVLQLIKEKAKENDTYKLAGVYKTSWKYKLPNQLHRSTIYRRKLKLIK